MYFPMLALVLALLLPAFPAIADQSQTPAPKAACCQMNGDHAGHGDAAGATCCNHQADAAACKHCQDGNCADCCKDGTCKDGCCKEACCKDGKCAGCAPEGAACCKKSAPKR
jgi:hypothetical protein